MDPSLTADEIEALKTLWGRDDLDGIAIDVAQSLITKGLVGPIDSDYGLTPLGRAIYNKLFGQSFGELES